jgi:hypothetical protein
MTEPRDPTSAIPGTRPREETQGKERDSQASPGKSGPIRLNQRCVGLSARPFHELDLELFESMFPYHHKAEMKDLQGMSLCPMLSNTNIS